MPPGWRRLPVCLLPCQGTQGLVWLVMRLLEPGVWQRLIPKCSCMLTAGWRHVARTLAWWERSWAGWPGVLSAAACWPCDGAGALSGLVRQRAIMLALACGGRNGLHTAARGLACRAAVQAMRVTAGCVQAWVGQAVLQVCHLSDCTHPPSLLGSAVQVIQLHSLLPAPKATLSCPEPWRQGSGVQTQACTRTAAAALGAA